MRNKRFIGGVAVLALLAGTVVPANAQRWGGYGGHHRHHHDHDGLSAGDVFGIAALIGAVAIIASASSKDRAGRPAQQDRDQPRDRSSRDWTDDRSDADVAVSACANAVRDEAAAGRGYAEILDMDPAYDTGEGWRVEGRVERRDSWSDRNGDTSRFSCTVRNGQVADVNLSSDTV